MITLSQCGWGSYSIYSGPLFWGSKKMDLVPVESTTEQKLLQVITATEGGAFDAINMYDKCIMTCGLIQWCDAGQYSVCDMLGEVDTAGGSIEPVRAYAAKMGWTLKRSPSMKMRFFQGNNQVDTTTEQKQLYLGGSSGRIGEWNSEQKTWARGFAVAMANCFQDQINIDAQIAFTAYRLMNFVGVNGKKYLFAPGMQLTPYLEAARAAYISYAANLPVVADKMLGRVAARGETFTSEKGVVALLKEMAFGPGITLYPSRYNKIRPHLERFYAIDLPDFAKDLQTFKESLPPLSSDETSVFSVLGIDPNLTKPEDLQAALQYIGYDLGPAGVDGRIGSLTKTAITNFQSVSGLQVDGVVGKLTRARLIAEVLRKAG